MENNHQLYLKYEKAKSPNYRIAYNSKLSLSLNLNAQVAVNTSGEAANGSAMLDVSSTEKGILIPRMNVAQRDLIDTPITGLMIYQTDNTPGFYFYDGSAWVVVGNGATTINSLYDGASDGSSVFLGNGAGANDNGTTNQNLGYGISALNANINGYENTAIGIEALKLVEGGHHNTALGIHSLSAITTGSSNTALGTNAGISNTGSGNIFIGANAAYNELGSNKLFIENSASATPLIYGEFDSNLLRFNGTLELSNGTSASSLKFFEPSGSGTNYTRFQSQAQAADVTYTLPVDAGTNGQLLKTDGSGSLSWADDTNTGATDIDGLSDGLSDGNSLFMGADAGNLAGSNKFNTGLGVWSLKDVTTGLNNTALGTSSLMSLTEGSNNTVIGTNALQTITTTSNNTVLGTSAGQSVTGSGNVFIGNEVAKTQTSISNKLFIDNSDTINPLIYGDFENDTIRVNGHFDVSRTMSIDSGSIIGQLAVNTDGSPPSESAILDLKSTSSGFLPPRMTTAQRNSISNPEEGLMIFNTESKLLDVFTGTQWKNPGFGISCGEVITDADGNLYSTVAIGNQCWMRENLNVGTMINLTTGGTNNDGEQTDNGTIEKYCYDDDPANCDTTGGLYQWNEMMQYETSEQGICPDGWHIPNDSDWTTLSDYLGGESVAGCKMKETGTAWGTDATNTSFFTGLPAGFTSYGSFSSLYTRAFWYSNTNGENVASCRVLMNSNCALSGMTNAYKAYGFSVRCIKY